MNKVLLVEDDKFLVRIYQVKLAQLGLDVTYLSTGEDVLKTALKIKPDLILLDIVMPIRDGIEAMKDLKGNTLTKDIPVMVLSNLNSEKDIKTMIDLGVKSYMVKSDHSFTEVSDKILKVLHGDSPIVK